MLTYFGYFTLCIYMPTTLLGANQHFLQWTVANSNKHQSWTQWHFLTDIVCWCGSLINNNPHDLIYTLVHYVIKGELFCQQHNGHHKQLFTIFNRRWLKFVRIALSCVLCLPVRQLIIWLHTETKPANLLSWLCPNIFPFSSLKLQLHT